MAVRYRRNDGPAVVSVWRAATPSAGRGDPEAPRSSDSGQELSSPEPLVLTRRHHGSSASWLPSFCACRGVSRRRRACVAVAVAATLLMIGLWIDQPGAHVGGLSTKVALSSSDRRALREKRVFIALNVHNSQHTLQMVVPQLLRLVKTIGPSRCMVSVYENGSTDRSYYLLQVLRRHLMMLGARSDIVSDPWKGWWELCGETNLDCSVGMCTRSCKPLPEEELRPHRGVPRPAEPPDEYELAMKRACGHLEDCDADVRVPVMAALRNKALTGLADYAGMHPGDDIRVLFLNDVYITAESMAKLLLTNGMDYDVACAMDFAHLKLHDIWVARDLNGEAFNSFYPFVAEPAAQAALKARRPFRVYSCWNGAVVLPAKAFVQSRIAFRSWRVNEPASPHPAASGLTRTFNKESCAVSECHLIMKDLWQAGYSRVWMNPGVSVTYDRSSHWLQRYVMAPLNQLLLRWAHRVAPHPDHPRVTERLDSRVTSGKAAATLPLAVTCGPRNNEPRSARPS